MTRADAAGHKGLPSGIAMVAPTFLRRTDLRIHDVNSPDHDRRTFECPSCDHSVTEVVKYK